MATVFKAYMTVLNTRPILTKSLTSAVIMGGGDMIQQSIEQWPAIQKRLSLIKRSPTPDSRDTLYDETTLNKNINSDDPIDIIRTVDDKSPPLKYDLARMSRMAAFGLCVVGPLCHQWYVILESTVTATGIQGAFAKMALDQSIMAPLSTVLFFTSMSAMERKTVEQTKQVVKDKTWPTLLINWKIWPVAQMINMYFVPVSLRVLFLNVIGLGYNTILSKIANNPSK